MSGRQGQGARSTLHNTGRIRIGDHGRLTPEEARKLAKVILGAVESGADPIAERRAARDVRTFKAVAEDFLSLHVAIKRKARTGDEYRRILETRVVPALGSKRIVDIRRADVAKLHGRLSGTPYGRQPRAGAHICRVELCGPARRSGVYRQSRQGNRALSRTRAGAVSHERRTGAPGSSAEGRRNHRPALHAVDDSKPNAKHAPKADKRRTRLDPFAAAAIRLLILTGARLREILDARWEHVDLERGVIFLADSKIGRKPVYLSAAAQSLLASIPRVSGNPHIIAGEREGAPRADLKKPWAAVCKAAGLDRVRLHDLRHSFASIGAGASMGLPIGSTIDAAMRGKMLETSLRCQRGNRDNQEHAGIGRPADK
jgi:integrase